VIHDYVNLANCYGASLVNLEIKFFAFECACPQNNQVVRKGGIRECANRRHNVLCWGYQLFFWLVRMRTSAQDSYGSDCSGDCLGHKALFAGSNQVRTKKQ
jgi:hypothetical protein